MGEKDSQLGTGTGEITRQKAAAASLENNTNSDERSEFIRDTKLLEGWRLFGVLSSLAFGLLLAVLETSITATALVSISDYFGNSVNATWVVLAYLLSYMGFATIFARASDGIGRKEATIVAWVFFGAFSLGGGLAKTLNQLIAFRVLQGIGGSGLYAMIMVVGPEITPLNHWGAFSGMLGMTIATGSVLGPILGGLITTTSTWRWIYLFNAPCAVIGIASMLLSWPRNKKAVRLSLPSLQTVDFFGAILLLAASTLLVFALQEAGSPRYAWSSSVIVSTLVLSSVCWLAFFAWIAWLSLGNKTFRMRAILPLHVLISRPTGPIQAGVRLLPLLCSMALGSGLGGAVSSATKKNLTSHTLIVAACLILLGCGLMSTLSGGLALSRAVYGYQFVLGLGIGLTLSSGTMMTTLANEPDDVAAAQGALSQARILGGSTGLATATIILNHRITVELTNVLDPNQLLNLESLLSSITSLTPSDQAAIATVYTEAFTQQMRVCTYLSAACVVGALATFQQRPASVRATHIKQGAASSESDSPS